MVEKRISSLRCSQGARAASVEMTIPMFVGIPVFVGTPVFVGERSPVFVEREILCLCEREKLEAATEATVSAARGLW